MKTHATEPKTTTTPPPPRRSTTRTTNTTSTTKSVETPRTLKNSTTDPSTSNNFTTENYNTSTSYISSSSSSSLSKSSLTSLKNSLPENPHIYSFSEICVATNNFLSKRFSSSSSSAWRCTIRGKDVLVFQRRFRRAMEEKELRERLHLICKSHHMSIVKLLGASLSGEHIYLVYDYVNGANLSDCLRNIRNPNFTVLSTWVGRMQVATDLAQALEYIHHYTGLNLSHVHNHIKSSSILVTEPSFNAKVCHFGTAELCGEIADQFYDCKKDESEVKFKRLDSRAMKFEGARGYMSPEFQLGGTATQNRMFLPLGKVSLIETAAEAIEGEEGRLRRWVDGRLRDSYPVELAEKMIRVGLDCVHVDPEKRPDMKRVAGKVSNLYLKSRKWTESMKVPTEFTVSLAPR
ncbi:hypothetical protein GIB67_002948 [Kingdonia uniflora]|uniref:Protein kinase domain-containing protein n=1 Tax=Kingdonia uniflora TaxID=39325 RepID=A0A7J7M8P7_9MAGN|nr:hypothetical protein GIB67_002948 [Kingdonia uniflora]